MTGRRMTGRPRIGGQLLASTMAGLAIVWGLIAAPGCLGDEPVDPHCDELLPVHIERLEDFIAGDAEATVQWFSPDLIDAGGGVNGNGQVPVEVFSRTYWEGVFNSFDFQRDVAGRQPDALFDLDATVILDRDARVEQAGHDRVGVYRLFEADCIASTPPRPEAEITGAWFGVYRKSSERWWVVAID